MDAATLAGAVKDWGRGLGFADVAICAATAEAAAGAEAEARLAAWLAQGFHGSMDYMRRHGLKRTRPAELVPGTVSVITARMDYVPDAGPDRAWIAAAWRDVDDDAHATVARYAHGRDYHKVLRTRLQRLADRIAATVGPFGHRVFTDSAPVMEVELARRSGLGWRGKHTLLLSRTGGSMFFIGEIFVDLALPPDAPVADHCGRCTRCLDVCPTRAIVAPYVLDARRCLSYLTIEHDGPIPEEFRAAMGNRVYGCDDCQLVCPWNKFATRAVLPDFDARPVAHAALVDAFAWDEAAFLLATEGSAIRRIGHERWLRNVAVALGNALRSTSLDDRERGRVRAALAARRSHPSALVREHVAWALAEDDHRATTSHSGSVATDSTVDAEMRNATIAPLPPIRTARM